MKQLIPFILICLFSLPLAAQSVEDKKAIHQVVQTMVDGWNAADGEKFASVFAEKHDFIVWTGFYFKESSMEQNAASHNRIFSTIYKGTENHATIDKIRFVREDIVMVHVFSAVTPKEEGRPEHPDVMFTALMEKQNGSWKILSFHNLDLEVFQDERMKKSSPVPPAVMYASWYADAKK